MAYRCPAGAAPVATAHRCSKLALSLLTGGDVCAQVCAADHKRCVAAQGGVQRGTAFGQIDRVAPQHPGESGLHTGLIGQLGKQLQRIAADPVMSTVGRQRAGLHRQALSAAWVGCQRSIGAPSVQRLPVTVQLLPGGKFCRTRHSASVAKFRVSPESGDTTRIGAIGYTSPTLMEAYS